MTPAEWENDLEGKVSPHVKDALPLASYGDRIPVLGIEVLRQVQVIGIGDIGEVGAIEIKRADCLSRPVDEIGSEARIEQGIGGGWDLGV